VNITWKANNVNATTMNAVIPKAIKTVDVLYLELIAPTSTDSHTVKTISRIKLRGCLRATVSQQASTIIITKVAAINSHNIHELRTNHKFTESTKTITDTIAIVTAN
jgi:hypothetical protein